MTSAATVTEPTSTVEATANDDQEGPPIHPLFMPQKPGDLPLDVRFFTVERELPGTDTPKESAGVNFPASEIPDLAALVGRFGGGLFHLKARTARSVLIPGGWRTYWVDPDVHPPQPLIRPKARPAPPAPAVQAAPAPVAPPSAAGGGAEIASVVAAAMTAIQSANADAAKARDESQKQMLAMMQRQHEQHVAMLQSLTSAKIEGSGANARDAFLEGIAFERKQSQELREMLREEVAAKGSGSDTIDKVIEGAAQAFVAKQMGGAETPK